MMDHGAVRNLEQIQEHDAESRTPKLMAAALVMLGGACVVFATLALSGRKSAPAAPAADPLGDLVAQHGHAAAPKPSDLSAHDVTFPAVLSDQNAPTTALAAVRGPTPAPTQAQPPPPSAPDEPPPPTDRLPVVPMNALPAAAAGPIPAQNVLEATPVVTRPRDALTKTAADTAQITAAAAPAAAAGHEGGYQLQVSSFRTQAEANEFADQLRARGHKAYVLEAHVTGRGTWFRVRIGPFPTQHAAASYRVGFEAKEHVVPFVVPPASHDGTAKTQSPEKT